MDQRTREIIDQMESLLMNSSKIPMTNLYMVDRNKMRELLQNLVDELPGDIARAASIIQNEARIISEARARAESTVAEANSKARQTVDEAVRSAQMTTTNAQMKSDELYHTSNEQANRILLDAQRRAKEIEEEAEQHAIQLVSEEEIVARAQAEADELRQVTQEEMEAVRQDMFNYLDSLLDETDKMLSEKIQGLRRTRQDIQAQR